MSALRRFILSASGGGGRRSAEEAVAAGFGSAFDSVEWFNLDTDSMDVKTAGARRFDTAGRMVKMGGIIDGAGIR